MARIFPWAVGKLGTVGGFSRGGSDGDVGWGIRRSGVGLHRRELGAVGRPDRGGAGQRRGAESRGASGGRRVDVRLDPADGAGQDPGPVRPERGPDGRRRQQVRVADAVQRGPAPDPVQTRRLQRPLPLLPEGVRLHPRPDRLRRRRRHPHPQAAHGIWRWRRRRRVQTARRPATAERAHPDHAQRAGRPQAADVRASYPDGAGSLYRSDDQFRGQPAVAQQPDQSAARDEPADGRQPDPADAGRPRRPGRRRQQPAQQGPDQPDECGADQRQRAIDAGCGRRTRRS